MNVSVNCCKDCPFMTYEHHVLKCYHPQAEEKEPQTIIDSSVVLKNCPLKKEPITIFLKEND